MTRFPYGLTVAAFLGFILLVGLGSWQVQRLKWKEGVIARIHALSHAPPAPIEPVLGRLAAGAKVADVAFTRVNARCLPNPGAQPVVFRFAERGEQVAWRMVTLCRLASGPYDAIALDRGIVERFTGEMQPGPTPVSPPGDVIGVLREVGGKSWLGGADIIPVAGVDTVRLLDREVLARFEARAGARHPAPLFLAAETETPAVPGLTPSALPAEIPNNHLVYAITWFSLAGILVVFYVALLRRRRAGT